MKNLLIILGIAVTFVSCGGGRNAEGTGIVNNTQDIRTSSDMDISPSNLTTPAPAVTKDTIEQKEQP
ncbi:hypothetical protein [Flavobacterium rhizosphaerae]|uniref:Cytochrome C551 n=1 Tax=Flavobacterium rhizosphaerae TaxID=3163298 RepID=A0ABW8YUM1_9FLAO